MNSLAVYCASSTQLEPAFHHAADLVGAGLAARGLSLVYGGGCIGLMGEVATSAPARPSPIHNNKSLSAGS